MKYSVAFKWLGICFESMKYGNKLKGFTGKDSKARKNLSKKIGILLFAPELTSYYSIFSKLDFCFSC